MSDLAERLADLQARNDEIVPYTDKQAMTRFCDYLSEGKTRSEAARLTGRTLSWYRARRNPEASVYCEPFALEYERIMAPGGDNKTAIAEEVFTAMVQAAKEGNVRAQEKILAAFSEDFGFLKPVAASGDLNVQQLQVFFGELPLERLMELKEAREAAKMKALPIVDA